MKFRAVAIVHSFILLIYLVHITEENLSAFFLRQYFGVWFTIVTVAGFFIFASIVPWIARGELWALYGSFIFGIIMILNAIIHVWSVLAIRDTHGAITGIGAMIVVIPFMFHLTREIRSR